MTKAEPDWIIRSPTVPFQQQKQARNARTADQVLKEISTNRYLSVEGV
jgi:hypothetical protein